MLASMSVSQLAALKANMAEAAGSQPTSLLRKSTCLEHGGCGQGVDQVMGWTSVEQASIL